MSLLHPGDKVLIPCITSCATCDSCRKGMYSHCRNGGWVLGNTIDGTQAEYVRIPHADTSLHVLADDADEEAFIMLSDILPTGFECGVLNGQVKPGDTVPIVGAGPIGLATLLTAQFFSPAAVFVVDVDDSRLQVTPVARRDTGDQRELRAATCDVHPLGDERERKRHERVVATLASPDAASHPLAQRIPEGLTASPPVEKPRIHS